MTNIAAIYQGYKIMRLLQEHQLRVAAVAELICKNFKGKIDIEGVVTTCLLHDMGNILKFDLNVFPEHLEPEGLEYWQAVKAEMSGKYQTDDEHVATELIAKEIGVSQKVLLYMKAVGFTNAKDIVASNSFEQKICCYADQRVVPFGVVSLDERMIEGKKRYQNKSHHKISPEYFDKVVDDLKRLESQIFEQNTIKPEDITDMSIKVIMDSLENRMIL